MNESSSIERCRATSGKEYLQHRPVLLCFLKEAFSSRNEVTVAVCSWETDDSAPIHAVERLFYEARPSRGWTWRGVWRQTSYPLMPTAVSDDCPFIRRYWHVLVEVFFNLWVVGLQKRSAQGISPFLLSREVYHQVKKELLKQHSALEGERKSWSLLWPWYTPVCNHL